MKDVYETDFIGWIDQQIKCLQERRFAELDVQHLIAELEGIASQEKRELRDGLVQIMKRRLKQEYLPQRSSDNWSGKISVIQQRIIRGVLEGGPDSRSFIVGTFHNSSMLLVKLSYQVMSSLNIIETIGTKSLAGSLPRRPDKRLKLSRRGKSYGKQDTMLDFQPRYTML